MISAGKLMMSIVIAASVVMTGCTIEDPTPLTRAKGEYVCRDYGGPYEYTTDAGVADYVVCNNATKFAIDDVVIEDPKYFNTEPAPLPERPNKVKI